MAVDAAVVTAVHDDARGRRARRDRRRRRGDLWRRRRGEDARGGGVAQPVGCAVGRILTGEVNLRVQSNSKLMTFVDKEQKTFG